MRVDCRRHGKRISPVFLPHVFERFRQADGSSTRDARRAGPGAVHRDASRRAARGTHDGRKRRRGHGSTFTVYLPIRHVEQRPASRSRLNGEPVCARSIWTGPTS